MNENQLHDIHFTENLPACPSKIDLKQEHETAMILKTIDEETGKKESRINVNTKSDCERVCADIDWELRSIKFDELTCELDGIKAVEGQYVENYIGLQTAMKSLPQSPENGWDHFKWLSDHRKHLIERYISDRHISARDGRFSNSKNVKACHDWNGRSVGGEIEGVIEWLKQVWNDTEPEPHLHKDDWVANSFLEAVEFDLIKKEDVRNRILICNESDLMKGIENSLVSALTEIFPSAKILNFTNLSDESISPDHTVIIVRNGPLSAAALEGFNWSFIIDPSEDDLISVFNRSFVNRETGDFFVKPSEDFDPLVDYSCLEIPSLSLLYVNLRKSRPIDGQDSIRVPLPYRDVFSVNEVKDMLKRIECRKDEKRNSVSGIRSGLSHIPSGSLQLCFNRFKSVLAETDHCFATLMDISTSTVLHLHYIHGVSSTCHDTLRNSSASSKTHEKFLEILESVDNLLKTQKEEKNYFIESLHSKVSEFLGTLENELVQVELIRIANRIDFINFIAGVLHTGDSDTLEPIRTTISMDLVEKVRATCEFPPDLIQFWESLLNISLDDDVIFPKNLDAFVLFILNEKDCNKIFQEMAKFEIFFVMKNKLNRMKNMLLALSSELTSSINNSVRFMHM